ncbi:MAG: radical SAM protein [Lachnospiraceae bacterium]|nr:radical SAM protein [Lachnospiraceae bacterium]
MRRRRLTFLLIHPEISRTRYNFVGVIENECLELEYISALLKKEGHEVVLYDGQVETFGAGPAIQETKADVVYVCGRARQENFMLEYCAYAKACKAITIIGGLHAQLCYERMYRPCVDFILTTFDIYRILDIVEYAVYHKEAARGRLAGVCYQRDGAWHFQPGEPFDIRRLPWPDRSYFDAFPNRYQYLELGHAAWVRTAYGCPYRCAFCHRNRMNMGQMSARDIDDVVEEIAQIRAENIYIADDDFLFDTDRLNRFVEGVRNRGIRKNYICYGRADYIAQNQEMMRRLKEIGLYYVLVGLESVEDVYLKRYEKRSDMNCNIQSVRLCNALGLHIMGMFIIDPDFRGRDFRAIYRWIEKHRLRHAALSIFTPELCTPMYEQYRDRMLTDNPSHFDYLHLVVRPANMGIRTFYVHYYVLLIRLFLKARREGVYDFIDYGAYIRSFLGDMLRNKRRNDDA